MDLFYLLLIIALTIGLSYYQIRILKEKWYSPVCLLIIPTCLAICVLYVITKVYDFPQIRFEFVCIIAIFFIFSSCFEILFRWIASFIERKNMRALNKLRKIENSNNILDALSIAVPIGCIVYFISLIFQLPSLSIIVQPEFQNIYASQTFIFRLMCFVLGAYSASKIARKSKSKIISCLLCLIPNALTFVKGTIIICVLSCLLTVAMCLQEKLTKKQMITMGIVAVIASFVAFAGVYLVEICIYDLRRLFELKTYQTIFDKIVIYLSSGLESFNINIDNTATYLAKDNIIWAPYNNLLSILKLTTRVDTVSDVQTIIGNIPSVGNVKVNTHTYFGTLYLYGGWWQAILAHFVNYVIIYTLYRWSKYSNMGKVCYSIHACGFILSWFEYYFMHTFWVYLLALYVIAICVDCLKIGKDKFEGIKKGA